MIPALRCFTVLTSLYNYSSSKADRVGPTFGMTHGGKLAAARSTPKPTHESWGEPNVDSGGFRFRSLFFKGGGPWKQV